MVLEVENLSVDTLLGFLLGLISSEFVINNFRKSYIGYTWKGLGDYLYEKYCYCKCERFDLFEKCLMITSLLILLLIVIGIFSTAIQALKLF